MNVKTSMEAAANAVPISLGASVVYVKMATSCIPTNGIVEI